MNEDGGDIGFLPLLPPSFSSSDTDCPFLLIWGKAGKSAGRVQCSRQVQCGGGGEVW